jgi:hypothetical protein
MLDFPTEHHGMPLGLGVPPIDQRTSPRLTCQNGASASSAARCVGKSDTRVEFRATAIQRLGCFAVYLRQVLLQPLDSIDGTLPLRFRCCRPASGMIFFVSSVRFLE